MYETMVLIQDIYEFKKTFRPVEQLTVKCVDPLEKYYRIVIYVC